MFAQEEEQADVFTQEECRKWFNNNKRLRYDETESKDKNMKMETRQATPFLKRNCFLCNGFCIEDAKKSYEKPWARRIFTLHLLSERKCWILVNKDLKKTLMTIRSWKYSQKFVTVWTLLQMKQDIIKTISFGSGWESKEMRTKHFKKCKGTAKI